jgi:CRP-like cAMP-binding protein
MSAPDAATISPFSVLKGRDRDLVLGNATTRTYAPGATLVAEGEPSVNLYFILEGHARVATAAQGQRGLLGPGDFFGELGIIERHPRTATITAEDELTVVMVSAWEFRDVLEAHPQMAVPMLYAMVSRLHGVVPHEHPGTDGDAA